MTVNTITGNDYTLYSTTDAAVASGAGASRLPGALEVGQETIPRWVANSNISLATGILRFSYLTAKASTTVSAIRLVASTVAAAATPTLVRFGLYSVAANGDLTLMSASASDTSTFAATGTAYTRNLAVAQQVTAGSTYAIGVLVVTGSTAPSVSALSIGIPQTEAFQSPPLCKSISAQTDLQASYTNAQLAFPGSILYAALV